MKQQKILAIIASMALICTVSACTGKKGKSEKPVAPDVLSSTLTTQQGHSSAPAQMPARYQNPGYMTSKSSIDEELGATSEEFQIRVGATIKSTSGPQPLWDVLKRLANLKGMTVSWASDVDQNFLVDVDINSQDIFLDAIANLLRQADYFYELEGKAIVVRNKTTKIFQLGMPSMRGEYTTTVGGNHLAQRKAAEGTEGIVKIASAQNEFDVWGTVQKNLDIILGVASKERAALAASQAAVTAQQQQDASVPPVDQAVATTNTQQVIDSNQRTEDGAFYIIDKSIGSITVTAKPSVMSTVENYLNNFKKQLYQQIAIEAKIIEVFLHDRSKVGLDWSSVLRNFNIPGAVTFGADGQVYPWVPTKGDVESPTRFISKVQLGNPYSSGNRGAGFLDFNVLLNALNEQGDSHVLSNPKITVLNGQPALISVGKDHAYVKEVTREVDGEDGDETWSFEVDNVVEGVALGVMANIVDGNRIVMHLTPITTELEGGEIPYKTFSEGNEVGLPVVAIRQMSTVVDVNDGEMLIIGGLIDNIEDKVDSFAPVVGKIPLVKYLFGYSQKEMRKRELVILLSPKII